MEQQIAVFAALSDPLRLRSLALMDAFGEVCVCQLIHAQDVPQSKISKHLGVLRSAGLVVPRRAAQWMLYRIGPLSGWRHDAVRAAIASLAADPVHQLDCRRFATAPDGAPVSRLRTPPSGGVSECVEIALGVISGSGNMTRSGSKIKWH